MGLTRIRCTPFDNSRDGLVLLGPTLLAVPVEFLSDDEAIRLGRYTGTMTRAELERLFFLDDADKVALFYGSCCEG